MQWKSEKQRKFMEMISKKTKKPGESEKDIDLEKAPVEESKKPRFSKIMKKMGKK